MNWIASGPSPLASLVASLAALVETLRIVLAAWAVTGWHPAPTPRSDGWSA